MYVNQNPIWTTLTTVPEVTCPNTVLHYSGSVINPLTRLTVFSSTAINWHWQCLIDSYYITLTPTTDCNWMHTITKISDSNSWQCCRYCTHSHFPSPHCHGQWQLTVINWHWQSSTDNDSHQMTLATDSAWLHLVIYWPGPDFTGRYGSPSFRAWISSALNTSNSSDSLLVGWNSLNTGNGATNLGIWINRYNSIKKHIVYIKRNQYLYGGGLIDSEIMRRKITVCALGSKLLINSSWSAATNSLTIGGSN